MRREAGIRIIALLKGLVLAVVLGAQAPPSPLQNALTTGEALQKKGDYAGALEIFRRCAAVSRQTSDENGMAICQQLIGGADRLLGDYPDAEANYREALVHAEKAGDLKRTTYILNNLANLFGAQGRYSETIALLRRCLEISRQGKLPDDAAPYQNLAISYALQGDHARALESFLNALRIYERLGLKSKIALVHYNLGILQMKQGNYTAAKRELTEAQTLAEKSGDHAIISQSLGDLGRVQDIEGHPAEALASFQKALSLCRQAGFKTCIGEGELNLGNFHVAHLQLEPAAAAFDRAREIFELLNDPYNLGQTLRGLGYVARLRAQFSEAKDYASRAAALSRQIGDPDGEWQAQALLGLIANDAGDRAGARVSYGNAILLIESQRGKVGGGETERQRFFEKAVYPYQQLALLEAADHRPLAALRAAESARARTLLDMLSGDSERIGRLLTAEERSEETRLLATIAGLNARLARASAADKNALAARQQTAWGEYEAFRAALYVRHPELRSWRGESPVIREEDLVALLPDAKTAVIEFLCSKDQTLLLVATRGTDPAHPNVLAFPLALSRDELTKRAGAFRLLLEQRDPGFRGEARELFRRLLEPAAAALRGKTRIQFVPDGPLTELPFQALVDRTGKYWIETVTLAWAPSLTFLHDQARRHPAQRSAGEAIDLLALGDPAAPGVPPIPILREQVARIAALYPRSAVVRTGAAADEAAFRQFAPNARVLHLATHGIADAENAMRSRLLLARSEGEGAATSGDGWLEAWELMRLDLNADVAVLSACETGRGYTAEGEGLVGLTWALFVAGVHHTVVSQWRVESQSTTALMTKLHRGLQRGESPAAALRLSTLALMKDARYRHPFYWGAFVAAGNF